MSTMDFFRACPDQMIDLHHPLAVPVTRMPWVEIEKALAPAGRSRKRICSARRCEGLASEVSNRGRPRLPIRLMVVLLYVKHASILGGGELAERLSENEVWQFFSGMAYYTPKLLGDAMQTGRSKDAWALSAGA